MAYIAVKVELTNEERKELESLRRSRKTALARRAALEAAEGLTNKEAKPKMTAATAGKWRRRFAERRLDGLRDEPRPGAPRRDGDIAGVIRRTRNAAGRRPMEPALHVQSGGLRPSTIHRIRRAFRLKPNRSETLSKDPPFVEKARDGLYLDPPERALVLSVDEKSQMQALDRALMRPGQAERRTHDYKRDGTTSLFAGPRRRYRQGDWQVPPQRGIPKVSRLRQCSLRYPHRHGQLRGPQNGSQPVRQTPALACPLRPVIRLVDQPGRTLLRFVDGKAIEARRPPVDRRPRAGHPLLCRQRRPETVPPGQIGGRNSGATVLPANA